jgi:ApaG protein
LAAYLQAAHSSEIDMLEIQVNSCFWHEKSDAHQGVYVFVYSLKISNLSPDRVQILGRHWVICDGFGQVREIRGDGVVGVQPIIEPAGCFEYSSSCQLSTPFGSMHGEYLCVTHAGEQLLVDIPRFELCAPQKLH